MQDFIHKYETKMEFTKIGHDFSLDFVKGICILLVVMNHSIDETICHNTWFWLWGYPAVPLFLLIQVFQSYKKGFKGIPLRLGRIWERAVFPFLVVEIILCTYSIITMPTVSTRQLVVSALYWGGIGPGSYYPWIYFQFAILIPILCPLFRTFSEKTLLIFFLVLSVCTEMLCHYFQMSEWLYRLLFFRYLFLIYLGYQLVLRGIVLNFWTVSLSIISLIAVCCFEFRVFDFTPFFYNSEKWITFHWICYYYMVYLMLFALSKFFYWLPPKSVIENIFCKMGRHSYAIYVFQLFYFCVIAPIVLNGLSEIGNKILESVIYVFVSVVVCVVSVLHFVSGLSNWVILKKVGLILFAIVVLVTIVRWQWRPFYVPPKPFSPYEVKHHQDDTLRVIMIGDSWVYFHQTLRRDSTFEEELKRVLGNKKVKVIAKGKGGTTSGEIYQRMSDERTMEMDYELNNSAQSVIEAGADYCVISAGINDARQRRGKYYYVESYLQIIRLLLSQNIKPVVMEIPNVDIDEAYDGNSLYYKIRARLMMSILGTELRGVNGYRYPLRDSLIVHHLMDSIVYISADKWNPDGWHDKRHIYTDDGFHLTLPGYALLDSTFASEIVKDYCSRHH